MVSVVRNCHVFSQGRVQLRERRLHVLVSACRHVVCALVSSGCCHRGPQMWLRATGLYFLWRTRNQNLNRNRNQKICIFSGDQKSETVSWGCTCSGGSGEETARPANSLQRHQHPSARGHGAPSRASQVTWLRRPPLLF